MSCPGPLHFSNIAEYANDYFPISVMVLLSSQAYVILMIDLLSCRACLAIVTVSATYVISFYVSTIRTDDN